MLSTPVGVKSVQNDFCVVKRFRYISGTLVISAPHPKTAMQFSYTSNVNDVIKELNAAAAETRPAVVRALNKTMDRVKVRAAREVRDAGYKLKISDIKKAIRLNRATSGRLRADAVASGRPIPLIQYNAKQVGAGVSVDVLNGRKVVAKAFIATTPSGSTQVFIREPNAIHKKVVKGGKVQWSALPIRKLYGPSIPDALANKAVADAIVQLIGDRFPVILEHEHSFLLKRLPKQQPLPAE